MAALMLEGTWEEITARSEELAGKRVRVVVETAEAKTVEADAEADDTNGLEDIPRVGPPNEGMLAALRQIRERQKGRPQTMGNAVATVRYGRTGPIYGREPVDD